MNLLTGFVILLVVVFVSYLCYKQCGTLQEDLTLYSPYCYSLGERDCINSPGCQWVIDNDYNGYCTSNTSWYMPTWFSSWWDTPSYRGSWSYPRYYPRRYYGGRHRVRHRR